MVELPRTFDAVQKLLELLRCDHCNAPLHEPFTTGVCDHLLCPQCRLGGTASRRNESCPVCHIPVRPKDCQLHPQVAQLVLVARRLKKLTLPSSLQKEATNENADQGDPDGGAAKFKKPVPTVMEHGSNNPRVVLKRAYAPGSSITSLSDDDSIKTKVTLKRGISRDRDPGAECTSLTSVARTQSSSLSRTSLDASSTISISRKLRLDQSEASVVSSGCLPSGSVRRLSAYRGKSKRAASSDAVSKNVFDTKCLVDIPLLKVPTSSTDPPQSTHGVNSDSLESVLKAATRVHNTRRSLKRGVFLDMTPSMNVPVAAPVASPENSCLTDFSRISPNSVEKDRVSSVTLSRLADQTPLTPTPRTHARSSSVRMRFSKNKNSSEDTPTSLRVRSSSSTRIVQLLNKLRPNSKGESALHRAAIRGNYEQLKECLGSGISPDVRDHAGWTPLHEAALHGHRDIVEALLNAGATVDIPGGPDLDTPLHDAIQNAQFACCELLLEHGANPILPNGVGLTPLQLVDLSISKLNDSKIKVKVTPKSAKSNTQNAIRNTLLTIRDLLMNSITKHHPPVVGSTVKLNESMIAAQDTVSRHSYNSEALNPSLSISFKERRRLRPVLLATGLSRPQKLTFSRVATMIRAQVVNNISPDVTHVITGAVVEVPPDCRSVSKKSSRRGSSVHGNVKPSGKLDAVESYEVSCPRTLKFLSAVLQGCWVLSFDWIETCAHVKMRVEEEGFEVTGCSTTPHSGAPRRARLAREAGSLGLFYGFRFCFLGQFEYPMPPRNELAQLVRAGGALVVFCREHCSPLRLARLAIEGSQTDQSIQWELVAPATATATHATAGNEQKAENANRDNDDGESDGESSIISAKLPELSRMSNSPLLVVYDSRAPGSTGSVSTPYAIKVVSDALSLVRPCALESSNTNSPKPPLRAIPASWILDCAAEYAILPLSTF
ncbi:hypothetical protein FGIG_09315 [Fasciola gigantica]|uniref:BRCA1-associated RING domain protein 1 n=1 Tax=Fasciola gigantica TaxID=46835 RepID=A0A504YCJ4_FASGI|nr:hypothetical protein FGIG_09315 [Fasciola gigantica]